jgi:hypothetical protein
MAWGHENGSLASDGCMYMPDCCILRLCLMWTFLLLEAEFPIVLLKTVAVYSYMQLIVS